MKAEELKSIEARISEAVQQLEKEKRTREDMSAHHQQLMDDRCADLNRSWLTVRPE